MGKSEEQFESKVMKPCIIPFKRLTVEYDGNVSFCCPAYNNNYFIGNIFKDEFEDMWFGQKAQEFRKSILDGSYKYCNLDICASYLNNDTTEVVYPKFVNLNYSRACNVRCITCRDKILTDDNDYLDKFMDKFLKICSNVEVFYLIGGGEVFVSNHFKKLVNLLVKQTPNVKFILHTNGLLCDEKHIKDFGFDGRIRDIYVSVHAATKNTYEKIVRGGRWNQLQKNLKYLSDLKKGGKISKFYLMFVLHSLNYQDMPKFVKMANKLGAEAHFCRFRNWCVPEMCRDYDKYTCWDPKHKDYKKFLKVLAKLKNMEGYILDEEFLKNLQSQVKNTWFVNFFSKFKKLVKHF